MKASDKLEEAFKRFRPHINGHATAMDLFHEALKEVKKMEEVNRKWIQAVNGKVQMKPTEENKQWFLELLEESRKLNQ